MRVVVTGSRDGHPHVREVLELFTMRQGVPELFVLGCAPGVDTIARLLCEKRRWTYARVYADARRPSPERYLERNAAMVALARPGDWCLAFPSATSRGTWHCLGLAREAQLRTYTAPWKAA